MYDQMTSLNLLAYCSAWIACYGTRRPVDYALRQYSKACAAGIVFC